LFINRYIRCLIGEFNLSKLCCFALALLCQTVTTHASDTQDIEMPRPTINTMEEMEPLVLASKVERENFARWLQNDCFSSHKRCKDPSESVLFWTGAGSVLFVGPALFDFGIDLHKELVAANVTALSPELLGTMSMLTNGVVFSVSAGDALELARPTTKYESPLVKELTFNQKLMRYGGKIVGPGQMALASAISFTLYNHSRFYPKIGIWTYPLDTAMLCALTASYFFFWDKFLSSIPSLIKQVIYYVAPGQWNAPTINDHVNTKLNQLERYLINASPAEVDEVLSNIQSAKHPMAKARALLTAMPEESASSSACNVYKEAAGLLGGTIGLISCYPNYSFTYHISRNTLIVFFNFTDSSILQGFCKYLGVTGLSCVAVTNSFGTYYAFQLIAGASEDLYTAYKNKKEIKCCRTLGEVKQVAMDVGKYVVLPLTYVGLSLFSAIPLDYIGLVGSTSSWAPAGITFITISAVATSYWGFDTLAKRVASGFNKQTLLHSVHKMKRMLPNLKETFVSYLWQIDNMDNELALED
jgi:hypothetical protein